MSTGTKIVFMGTPEFAVPSLEALCKQNYRVVGVVTAPDKPSGRGQKLHYSPVKEYCLDNGLTVLQPTDLAGEDFLSRLKSLGADIFTVVAFRKLPEIVWQLPQLGTINLHASLLPQYRGAAPINWAIINGETVTGVTTFFINEKIDTGNIIRAASTPIGPDETSGELHDRLMVMGATLLVETVCLIITSGIPPTTRQESLEENVALKPAPKIFKDDCLIRWNRHITGVHNFIRGLSPYPGAFTFLESPDGGASSLKIFRSTTDPAEHGQQPGTIITDRANFIKIAAEGGYILIHDLQLEGRKRMRTEEFLRGCKITDGWKAKG
jgi:methionyl-tRNA formyltransferase